MNRITFLALLIFISSSITSCVDTPTVNPKDAKAPNVSIWMGFTQKEIAENKKRNYGKLYDKESTFSSSGKTKFSDVFTEKMPFVYIEPETGSGRDFTFKINVEDLGGVEVVDVEVIPQSALKNWIQGKAKNRYSADASTLQMVSGVLNPVRKGDVVGIRVTVRDRTINKKQNTSVLALNILGGKDKTITCKDLKDPKLCPDNVPPPTPPRKPYKVDFSLNNGTYPNNINWKGCVMAAGVSCGCTS